MALDTSIYGLIQQPRIQSPMESFGQAMQLRALMDQSALAGLQRSELERGIAEEGKIRDLFSRGNVKPEELMAVSPKRGMEYQKSMLEGEKTQAEILAKRAAAMKDNLFLHTQALGPVGNQMAFSAWRANLVKDYPQFAQTVPEQFTPELKNTLLLKGEELVKLLTPKWERVTMPDGSMKTVDMNPHTNPQAGKFSAPRAMTPADEARLGEAQATNLQQERIAAAKLYDDTGVVVPPRQVTLGRPTVGPDGQWTRNPPAPRATPAPAPVAAATPTAAPAPGLSPKQERERAAERAKRDEEVKRKLDAYVAARNGLIQGLSGSSTGALAGRIPAFTSAQQIAEGAVSAMAPVLKELFRVAGEGVFTDRDQELLLKMVPTRQDSPGARKEKIENIDAIVSAKLGMSVPAFQPKEAGKASGIKFLGFE